MSHDKAYGFWREARRCESYAASLPLAVATVAAAGILLAGAQV
jgi:hypothetical protein